MEERREFNEKTTGFNYGDHSYMVAGYISDYKLSYDGEGLSVRDLKENRGYVDEHGYIHIFRITPRRTEDIPWFTIEMGQNGAPKLKFNPNRSPETRAAFHIDKVRDLSVANIIANADPSVPLYDEAMLRDVQNATKVFIPEKCTFDDFLKKLVKEIIILKDVNVQKYKSRMEHSYELSNLVQGLMSSPYEDDEKKRGGTKMSPFVFEKWMDLLGCDFEITVKNNGRDTDPLPVTLHYNSKTSEVTIDGEEKNTNLRSAK